MARFAARLRRSPRFHVVLTALQDRPTRPRTASRTGKRGRRGAPSWARRITRTHTSDGGRSPDDVPQQGTFDPEIEARARGEAPGNTQDMESPTAAGPTDPCACPTLSNKQSTSGAQRRVSGRCRSSRRSWFSVTLSRRSRANGTESRTPTPSSPRGTRDLAPWRGGAEDEEQGEEKVGQELGDACRRWRMLLGRSSPPGLYLCRTA